MSATTDEYVLARLESVEATIKAYCASVEQWKEGNARLGQAREQSIINSIFEAVQKAMIGERENSRNLFASLESKLASCTTIQDSAIDIIKSDVGEMRIEVTSHGTKIKQLAESHKGMDSRVDGLYKTVKTLIDAPGNKAKRILQTVGAGAIPVLGYGIYELLRSLSAAK